MIRFRESIAAIKPVACPTRWFYWNYGNSVSTGSDSTFGLCGGADPATNAHSMSNENTARLSHADLLQLKRWNTPTIYNGWEQITKRDPAADAFNFEETRDFMPQMGPMVGYAITVVFEPSKKEHRDANPNGWAEYRRHVASVPGPKIVIVQDLDIEQLRRHRYSGATQNWNDRRRDLFTLQFKEKDGEPSAC